MRNERTVEIESEPKPIRDIIENLDKLTDDERLEIFNYYCKVCGNLDPSCACWNDE